MELQGQVGPGKFGDGNTRAMRLDQTGAPVVQLASGKYKEAVLRGNVYTAQTAVTGVAPGTAIGTTAAYALANPKGSKVALVVLVTAMAYVSGTLGAGVVNYIGHINPAQATITGTAIVSVNTLIGNTGEGVGKALTTATVPASGSPLRPLCSLQASLATTAVAPWIVKDEVDGELVIYPGGCISLQATAAAGTSPLVVFSMTWEEVPLLS